METAALIPKHLLREEATAPKHKQAMGKDDFLKLLMTQLQHQDPVNPVNQQEFAAQLAQFSQLEQLSNIGTGIESLKGSKAEEAKVQMLGMIGKEVRASGSRVDLQSGQAVTLKYLPDAEATPVKATIYDGGGAMVREIDLSGKKGEGNSIIWDGKDIAGNASPTGKYTFRVHGVDKNGQAKELSSELTGRVTGLETEGNQAVLIVDTGSGTTRIDPSKISRVSMPGEKTAAPAAAIAAAPKPELPRVIQLGQLEESAQSTEDGEDGAEPVSEGHSWNNPSEFLGRLGR